MRNKNGSEMVEASISMPIIILVIILMLRVFAFYLQIVTTSIECHEKALNEWDKYKGNTIKKYEKSESVKMIKGGLLTSNLSKEIETETYFINEDFMVRTGEIINNKE